MLATVYFVRDNIDFESFIDFVINNYYNNTLYVTNNWTLYNIYVYKFKTESFIDTMSSVDR